ncbi:MAG: F0F1 ATP synthase subunit B [Mycoplasmataceae bacterium]|nr:F0F1 ATP synthase subunit B [Mycoplasmataceae bacterium]
MNGINIYMFENRAPNVGDIGGIIEGLFPSLYVMLATIGAFIVTLIILSKLFYGPVKKMMKKRHDFIQKNIDDSIILNEESAEIKSLANDELIKSKLMAIEIISKSQKESEILKEHYITEGKKEADRLIKEANISINFKLEKIAETRNNDIVDVAMIISQKIISENVHKEKIEEYLNGYINGK